MVCYLTNSFNQQLYQFTIQVEGMLCGFVTLWIIGQSALNQCLVLFWKKAIVELLIEFSNSTSLISDHQFGFRAGHLINGVDQLLLINKQWYYRIFLRCTNSWYCLLWLFEGIWQSESPVLLEKLLCIWVHPSLFGWIGQFLQLRSMCGRIADKNSRTVLVCSRDPQGSVLEPILFLI